MAEATSRRRAAADTNYSVELPRNPNGEVDWNEVGKLLTMHMLTEVTAASSVDFKYGQLSSDSQLQLDWQFSYEKDGIMVFKKRLKDSPLTCFMGRGLIDAPMDEVSAFIKKVENNLTWDKFLVEVKKGLSLHGYKEAKYLKILSESEVHTDYIGYQRFELTGCFKIMTVKRDMLYYVRCLHTDGKYVQAGLSVEDPDYPPVPGIPRIELMKGTGFVIEPYKGDASKTLVNYCGHFDVKRLPSIMMNQVMKRHPLALRYIRRHFVQPRIYSRCCDSPQSSPLESTTVASDYYEETTPIAHFVRGRHAEPAMHRTSSEPTLEQLNESDVN